MPTCLTCLNQKDDQALEHHIHRPRHSFLSSEYVDSDQVLRPMHNLDASIFTAAAVSENDDGPTDVQPAKESNIQNNQRNCTFYDAQFSIFTDYYVLQCLGPDVPWAEIRTVDGNQIGKHNFRYCCFSSEPNAFNLIEFFPIILIHKKNLHFSPLS